MFFKERTFGLFGQEQSRRCVSAFLLRSERGSSTPRALSPTGHALVAACLGMISALGILNNLLVLVLFGRYKALRSPINMLLLNISVSDLLVCALATPFSFAASARGRWLIGEQGCVWYGFANSLLGIVSLISLAVLSYERYSTMMGPTEADATNYRKVAMGVLLSWVYSLFWTLPPFFGWSRYGPEGPGTTCSVDWTAKTANNISYIICLFIFCLILPFLAIVYSYGKLLHAIKQVSGVNTAMGRKREHRVLLMVITMVVCYLLCWLPYGIMALMATFGDPDLITAEASIVPSLLAKTSTVINPIIYIFMNKQLLFRLLTNQDIMTSEEIFFVSVYSDTIEAIALPNFHVMGNPPIFPKFLHKCH
uniref:G-protein coupled receptors family 1 profile domain-containing protein n=1 Tax=Pygocentrus nattereri TaxID=42514 RepID=A0AAR2K0N1_PYGNA